MHKGDRVRMVGTSLSGTVLSANYGLATVRLDTGRVWMGSARSIQLEGPPENVKRDETSIVEWRAQAQANARHAEAARATARVAIGHLQRVLQDTHARIPSEQRLQWRRDAEDWLASIGADQ